MKVRKVRNKTTDEIYEVGKTVMTNCPHGEYVIETIELLKSRKYYWMNGFHPASSRKGPMRLVGRADEIEVLA